MSESINNVFRKNSEGFFDEYKWMIVVFSLGISCDAISTVFFMYESGPETELHPAVKISSMVFGIVGGPLIGGILKAIAGISVSIYLRKYAGYILFAGSVISFWAAWYNIWGYKIYTPYLLKIVDLL